MDNLNIKNAAQYLGRSEKTLRRWVKKGRLHPETRNGEYRFLKPELDKFRKPSVQASQEPAPEAGEGSEKSPRRPRRKTAETPDSTTIIIDTLATTVDALKGQLTVKDKQMEAKDRQIQGLMKASERSDIILKGLQDRVTRLEAPGEPEGQGTGPTRTEQALDTRRGVQSDDQADVQSAEQGSEQEQSALEGEFEEVVHSRTDDVQAQDSETTQKHSDSSQPAEAEVAGNDPLQAPKQGIEEQDPADDAPEQTSVPEQDKPVKAKPGRRWWSFSKN